jgi:lysophospholipase L1-like esterase
LANRGYQNEELKIIAATGWRTDNLLTAIQNANLSADYNLVSLLIGVNNQFQREPIETYIVEFEDLLKTAIDLAGGVKSSVFVVSIPDYGYTPFGARRNQTTISQEIERFNEVNRNITGYYGIKYFNITPISQLGLSNPELVAGDGLHPSKEMYSEWVNLILEDIPDKFSGTVAAINSLENDKLITIYPNPVSDMIFIKLENYESTGLKVQLLDLVGKVIIDQTFNSSIFSLSLKGVVPGPYLLRINYDEKLITRKIIVQSSY